MGPKAGDVAGNFGGPFFTHLLSASATLEELADHTKWTGPDARRALKVMPSWMVTDVEYFLRVRRNVIEAVLEKWVRLSECVGQNIIQVCSTAQHRLSDFYGAHGHLLFFYHPVCTNEGFLLPTPLPFTHFSGRQSPLVREAGPHGACGRGRLS